MSQPNIIWLYCDELRTDALGCYGTQAPRGNRYARMQTPNLDWIAAHGLRFDNSFCNSPVCVPSRVSTLTGLYPEDTGVYHNEAAWEGYRMDHSWRTFPEVFAEHGYRTANFGKLHVPQEMQPWQSHHPEGGGMRVFYEDVATEDLAIIQPPGVPTKIGGHYPADRPFPPERVLQQALGWLSKVESPYLLRLSFLQPHTPVFPQPPYDTLYEDAPFPDRFETHSEGMSAFDRRWAELLRASEMTSENIRRAQIAYYGLVAWVDTEIGKLLEYLRASGQLENTVLVFGADHGASLGENGCYAKQRFAPAVHRVPRLIAWPGTLPEGKVRGDICEGLDLPRTLFALAGIDAPAQFKGRDLLSDPEPDAVYATIGYGDESSRAYPNLRVGTYTGGRGWPRRACIRTARYRLDKNVRIDGQPVSQTDADIFLADVQTDPEEQFNLAHDPAHQQVVRDLSAQLDKRIGAKARD